MTTMTTMTTMRTAAASRKICVSGVPVRIIAERVEYIGPDGKLVTEVVPRLRQEADSKPNLPRWTISYARWNAADRKQAIIDELEEHGVSAGQPRRGSRQGLRSASTSSATSPTTSHRSPEGSGPRRSASAITSPNTARRPAPCSKPCSTSISDEGVIDLDDPNVLRIAPFDADRHARADHQSISAARPNLKPRSTSCRQRSIRDSGMSNVCPERRQVHPEHHAQGCRRRWRCPAHQPAVLDVLSQDHRRSGAGAANCSRTTTSRRFPKACAGATGPPNPRASPATHCSTSSTTSFSQH